MSPAEAEANLGILFVGAREGGRSLPETCQRPPARKAKKTRTTGGGAISQRGDKDPCKSEGRKDNQQSKVPSLGQFFLSKNGAKLFNLALIDR